jgi:hypothetical protein
MERIDPKFYFYIKDAATFHNRCKISSEMVTLKGFSNQSPERYCMMLWYKHPLTTYLKDFFLGKGPGA